MKMWLNATQAPYSAIKEQHIAALYDHCDTDARITAQFSRFAQLRRSEEKIDHMGSYVPIILAACRGVIKNSPESENRSTISFEPHYIEKMLVWSLIL